MEKQINTFREAYNALVQSFAQKYYESDAYIENELLSDDYFLHPIEICDEYWDIGDIYQAMQLDMPKHVVLSWYEFSYNDYQENWKMTLNFYHYFLQNKNK